MHLRKDGIRDQAMIGKDGMPAQRLVENRRMISGGIVRRKGAWRARFAMVDRKLGDPAQVINPHLRPAQGFGIDVRGIEHGAVFESLFSEQNRERVEFLPVLQPATHTLTKG